MLWALGLLGATAALAAESSPPAPPLWPLPASATSGSAERPISPELNFVVSSGDSPDLQAAVRRYKADLIFTHGPGRPTASVAAIRTVDIAVSQPVQAPGSGTDDEGYSLSVPAVGPVSISANTTVGAYRALETLSQLIHYDFEAGSYGVRGVPWAIRDRPRFSWRGVMIETSRHFLPVASILRTLDAMAFSKLNVLHWHIVDRESFPLQLESVPELARGAFSPQEKCAPPAKKHLRRPCSLTERVRRFQRGHPARGGVRTAARHPRGPRDRSANAHRILVRRAAGALPTPARAVSWRCVLELSRCPPRYCNPTVACSWNLTTARFDCGPCSPCEPLDPTAPAVFDVLEQVFTELASLFPDAVFHQGADEVLDPAEGFVHELCWQVRIVCLIAGAGPSRAFQPSHVLAELSAHRRMASQELPACDRAPRRQRVHLVRQQDRRCDLLYPVAHNCRPPSR